MAENEQEVEKPGQEETAGNPTESMPSGEEAPRTFTQAELDAILSERLRAEAAKAEAQRLQFERDVAARDAYIQGLMQGGAGSAQPADPTAGMTPEEQYLYSATKKATAEIEQKVEQALGGMKAMFAPMLAAQQVEDFFAAKPAAIPDAVKQRTAQLFKANVNRGATVDAAYRLAVAEYGEAIMLGQVPAPSARQPSPAQPPAQRPLVPHTELGGARRQLTPGAGGAKEYSSFKDFLADAANHVSEAPEDGAMFGPRGAGPYRKP